jgi:Fic family protein
MEDPGVLRNGTVIIKRGTTMVHMPPPAHLVPDHIEQLFEWLASTEVHPLVSGSIFHYELEFIHPFFDGNGRLGRLWQTAILGHWKSILTFLPLESVIHDRQKQYYEALGQSDQSGEPTPFVEFILSALKDACLEIQGIDHVTDHVTDHVQNLLSIMGESPLSVRELMQSLKMNHRPTFRKNYLIPALKAGFVEMTDPNSPKSPKQKYRLTTKGRRHIVTNQHSG